MLNVFQNSASNSSCFWPLQHHVSLRPLDIGRGQHFVGDGQHTDRIVCIPFRHVAGVGEEVIEAIGENGGGVFSGFL